MNLFKENPEEKHILDIWRGADEYKVVCGNANEVESRMNNLSPLYESDVFKENEDNTGLCVVMKKSSAQTWLAHFYTYY